METKGRTIHRGELLSTVVNSRHVNITQLVKRMGISRGTYYNHIADPRLSFERMVEYGKAIGYDFSREIPEMQRFVTEEPEPVYKQPTTLEEAIEQRDLWREKYYQLMEKYHRLIDEKREK